MNTEKHGLDQSEGSSLIAGPAAGANRALQRTAQVSLMNVVKLQSVFFRIHSRGDSNVNVIEHISFLRRLADFA